MSNSFRLNTATEKPPISVVQILYSLGEHRGGLTKAVFQRFAQLAEGRKAVLVTLAFQSDLQSIFEKLKKDGIIPSHTQLLNFHFETSEKKVYSKRSLHRKRVKPTELKAEKKVVEPGKFLRFFKSGSFARLVKTDSSGEILYVDVHHSARPWLRINRITPPTEGYPGLVEHYDDTQKVKYREFLNNRWQPYCSTWVDNNNWEYRAVDFTSDPPKIWKSLENAKKQWLQEELKNLSPSVLYTDETSTLFALSIPPKKFAHVTTIHTIHYANNCDAKDGFRGWWYRYQDQVDNLDTVVSFTDKQTSDLQKDLISTNTKFKVALHLAPEPSLLNKPRKNIVIVSRLSPEKRIDHAITAFAKIADLFAEQSLLIYGIGPEEKRLSNLISELGIGKQTKLMGFVDNSLEVFETAICSVSTSKYEGFGLTTLESLTMGTPVISYDVIYGSKHLIDDGKNGYLVPDGDIDRLAEKMQSLLSFQETDLFFDNCVKTADQYSFQKWSQRWEKIHNDASKSI